MKSRKELKQISKHELVEEFVSLQKSNKTFQSLLDHSPDLIARFDKQLRHTYVNPAITRATQISFHDYVGKTNQELGMPDDLVQFWNDVLTKAIESREEDTIEFEISLPAGNEWFESRVIPEIDDEGEVQGVIGITRNISNRKKIEQELRSSLNRLALTIEVSKMGIYEHAVPLDCSTYHSKKWAAILGYGREELPEPNKRLEWFIRRIHPDDVELIAKAYSDFLEGKTEGYLVEVRVKHKEGEWIWVKGSAKAIERSESGKVSRILGVMQDITERKNLEESLRQNEARLRQSQQVAKVGHWIWLYHKDEVVLSDELVKIFELESNFYSGSLENLLLNLVHPTEREMVKQHIQLMGFETEVKPIEFTIVLPNKAEKVVWSVFGETVRDINGRIDHLSGIIQDITERKQLEKQFYQSQKMEAIGSLAGGIAHDFNNLLVPIIGYSDLGMLSLPEDEKLHNNFSRINEAGKLAASLTHQILAFSRQQVLDMQTLDLNSVIFQFEEMLQRLIGEKIELKTFLLPSLNRVEADKGMVEQILMNLVINSRDAMTDGGTIMIETANVFLDERYSSNELDIKSGPYIMMAVTDTGMGMDERTLSQIFDPFFTTKERDKGTGLGLSTVYGIVRQHQGAVWAYSEVDKGTTIKIYLPVATQNFVEVDTAVDSLDSLYGTETILVAEDEAMVRHFVTETLQSYGYNVIAARTPDQCLHQAKTYEGTISLLLTDIIMPGMNGQELYKALLEIHPNCHVLYMSGYTDNVIIHHGILDEGVNFIQKPFTVNELGQHVKLALIGE